MKFFFIPERYKSERCNRFSFLEMFVIIGYNLQVPVLLVKCDLPFSFADRAFHFLRDAVTGIVLLGLSSSPASSSIGRWK